MANENTNVKAVAVNSKGFISYPEVEGKIVNNRN